MHTDLFIQENIIIPAHELEITASKAGGPGGQHTNKTDTKITVRWNIPATNSLTPEQKELVIQNLHNRITIEGDLIIHNSETRSQHQNRELALKHMAQEIRKALIIPKKRRQTTVSKATKEARLKEKSHRSDIKKSRNKKIFE